MTKPNIPKNENKRLRKLYHYEILDTRPEKAYDDLTELASQVCGTKISLVSLVDEDRQWFKSSHGLKAEETPRSISWCGHTILGNEIFEVPDSGKDERFKNNPLYIGEPKVCFYAGAPLITSDGYKLGTICVIDDHPRKLTEWQRSVLVKLSRQVVLLLEGRIRERKLEFILESGSMGSWRLNFEENCLTVDQRWTNIIDMPFSSQLERASWEKLLHPEDKRKVLNDIEQLACGKTETYQNIHRIKHADGNWVWVLERGKITNRDTNGMPVGIAGVTLDITNQKIIEQELRDNEEKVKAIYEGSHDAIILLTENGFFDCNKRALDLFQFSRQEDLIKLHPVDVSPKYQPDGELSEIKAQRYIESALTLGAVNFEWTHKKSTGECFIAEILLSSFQFQGRKIIQASARDITEKKKLEQSLEKQRQISLQQSKLASIGLLASGVGHEINNPLTIISGYLASIEKQLNSEKYDVELIKMMLTKTHAASDRIVKIVNNLRTLARAEEAQLNLFFMNEALEATYNLFSDMYKKEGITFTLDIEESEKLPVYGNKGRFEQALINLIANAKDATEGQEIRIINLGLKKVNEYAMISIRDNGQGIPINIQNKIFDQFFTTKDVNKGMGIGLSLVDTIIKDHLGRINFKTCSGQGTTFTIEIPINLSTDHQESIEEESVVSASPILPLSILYVDDEEDLRSIIESMFLGMGITIKTAENGIKALEECLINDYDLLITDLKMPKMDGFSLIKNIRSDIRIKQPKIVITTGGVDRIESEKVGQDQDVDGYLNKPYVGENIFRLIFQLFPERF